MLCGIIPVIIVAYIQLRITFRNMKSLKFSEPYEVAGTSIDLLFKYLNLVIPKLPVQSSVR
jgi:hypothetical protein